LHRQNNGVPKHTVFQKQGKKSRRKRISACDGVARGEMALPQQKRLAKQASLIYWSE
jgi:hypothetical protein